MTDLEQSAITPPLAVKRDVPKRRIALIVAASTVVLGIAATSTGFALTTRTGHRIASKIGVVEDSGIGACKLIAKAMNDGLAHPDATTSTDPKDFLKVYGTMNDAFQSSQYADLRGTGDTFMQDVKELNNASSTDLAQGFALLSDYSNLRTACAGHGVTDMPTATELMNAGN